MVKDDVDEFIERAQRRAKIIEVIETVAVGAFAVLVFTGLGLLYLSTYFECREHGFSVLYCLTRR